MPERTLPCMERIKEHGMYGILTSNGTQFNEEMIKELFECSRL